MPEKANGLTIRVVPSSHDPDCWPCTIIQAVWPLHTSKALREKWADQNRAEDDGNCREMSLEMAWAMCQAGYRNGWLMVEAEVNIDGGRRGIHAWNEYGGWAVDFSNGRSLIVERQAYSKHLSATRVVRQTVEQFLARRLRRKASA